LTLFREIIAVYSKEKSHDTNIVLGEIQREVGTYFYHTLYTQKKESTPRELGGVTGE
jgi:hypothetical protein